MFRISQTRPSNECSFRDLFQNFYPNTILQTDFAEFQGQNFMVIVDIQSGYGRVFKTRNKTTSAAVTAVRQWVNMYGRPTQIRCDAGPAYREGFIADMKKLGISVSHSSAYSPQSNSHAERFVRTLKTLLRKCGAGISQLELDELILCSNSQIQKAGQASSLDRFFGKSILTQIPNSLNQNFNWKDSMDARQRLREERVQKPQKGTKNLYQIGDEVTLQNPHTQVWDIPAQITGIRTAPDNKVLSYDLRQANGTFSTLINLKSREIRNLKWTQSRVPSHAHIIFLPWK